MNEKHLSRRTSPDVARRRKVLGGILGGVAILGFGLKSIESGSNITHPNAESIKGSTLLIEKGANVHSSPSFADNYNGISTDVAGKINKETKIKDFVFVVDNGTGIDGTQQTWAYVPNEGWACISALEGQLDPEGKPYATVTGSSGNVSEATYNPSLNVYQDSHKQFIGQIVNNSK